MRGLIKIILVSLMAINMVGCASITTDTFQSIQVTTEDQSQQIVQNANCTLKNKRGEWQVQTQGSIEVHKSSDNLLVKCSKDGMKDGLGTLISRANAGMWGNILIGGGIGAIIDHSKGTAYTYPTWVKIIMGDNLTYDRSEQEKDLVLSGMKMSEKELAEIKKAKEEMANAEVAKKDS